MRGFNNGNTGHNNAHEFRWTGAVGESRGAAHDGDQENVATTSSQGQGAQKHLCRIFGPRIDFNSVS